MTHAQIDDRFDDHPNYADYGAAEMGVIACGITYANRNLTDGVLPRVWAERRFGREGAKIAARLVEDGVWRQRDDGRFEIDGFLDHNPSRAEVLSQRAASAEAKARAGREGGLKSGAVRRARAAASAAFALKQNEAGAKHVVQAVAKQDVEANEALSSPLLSSPSPSDLSSLSLRRVSESNEHAGSQVTRGRSTLDDGARFPMPSDFPLTDEARSAAEMLGVRDVSEEWSKFRGTQIRDGRVSTTAGWYESFTQSWCVRAKQYQARDADRGRPAAQPPLRTILPPRPPPALPPPGTEATAAVSAREAMEAGFRFLNERNVVSGK